MKTTGTTKSAGAFRTISEVSSELDVPQHVLRFWETRFPQLHPLKRGGGRRYYRPEDVELLRRIQALLYTEGYTIRGVQQRLSEEAGSEEAGGEGPAEPLPPALPAEPDIDAAPMPEDMRRELRALLDELYEMRAVLAASS